MRSEPAPRERDSAGINGPTSVLEQIREIRKAREKARPVWPTIPSLGRYDLKLAADYNALYQHLTDIPGEDTAAGGAVRLYGEWLGLRVIILRPSAGRALRGT
ncbi:hypothetical protein [Thiohalorhabdus methylotrophus]|uniref:Uncharacterized protein n=1 Tax=Thiohalorhabdus methylotrophus TaxID=3242694 RepID=A0ABV4TTJ1_9GAMM